MATTASRGHARRPAAGLRRALVVGAGLPQAVNDATDVARRLKQHGYDHITLETRPQAATRAGLLTALDRIDSDCQLGNGGVLVVFLSMHGVVDATGQAVLNPWSPEASSGYHEELITMDELRRRCLKLRCQNVMVAIDACHAGGALRSEKARDKRSKRRQENRVFLASCAGAQQSFAWEGARNSQFTALLLDKLRHPTVPATNLPSDSDDERCLAKEETSATSNSTGVQAEEDGSFWSAWGLSRSVMAAYTEHDQHPQVEHCGQDFQLFSHKLAAVAQPEPEPEPDWPEPHDQRSGKLAANAAKRSAKAARKAARKAAKAARRAARGAAVQTSLGDGKGPA